MTPPWIDEPLDALDPEDDGEAMTTPTVVGARPVMLDGWPLPKMPRWWSREP